MTALTLALALALCHDDGDLKPERWSRLKELFERAVELSPSERDALLAAECAGEPDLRREIEALLQADQRADPFLERPAASLLLEQARRYPPVAMQGGDPFGWVGSTLDGQFAVEAFAGEGAFGVVYRGTHLGLETPIAIKCLKVPETLDAAAREEVLQNFRREARLLHQLSRRTAGIVQALDVGAATSPRGQWTPYTIMEWLEGETLADDLLARANAGVPPRSVAEAIELLRPAADALAVSHEENVTHRDVKPQNLFLARGRRGPVLKLLDFGIAKVFEETPTLTSALSRTGPTRMFTPQYAAPEQFSSDYGGTGPWTDVFALALVLIEVASGERAFAGTTMLQLCVASTDERNRPSLLARGVRTSRAVDDVLERALAVSITERYRSVGEMWHALEAAQRSTSTTDTLAAALPRASVPRAAPSGPGDTGKPMSWSSGESRLCTVVFFDLSAVRAELVERLDPSQANEVVERCFGLIQRVTEQLGGAIQRPVGDSVMAVFGVPKTSDNDAERAVHAALTIQAALARVPRPALARKAKLALRAGIHTGRALVPDDPSSVTVTGRTVNVAARLQQAAPEGTLLMGRDTYRQVASLFRVAQHGSIEVHGESVLTYRVLAPSAASRLSSHAGEFHGVATTLIDRVAERQRLLDALDASIDERSAHIVTLAGAPGTGKSRLLSDLLGTLSHRSEPALLLTAQCSPLGVDTSFGLLAMLLRQRFEIMPSDAPALVLDKLRRGLSPPEGAVDAAELDETLKSVAAVLGASNDASPTSSLSPGDGGERARHVMAAGIARLLSWMGARATVVILCEDVHWADDASLDLLDELSLRIEGAPLFIACTARPELYERRPHWGEGNPAHQRVAVEPLGRRYVEQMVRDHLQRVPTLSDELVARLCERADGSPATLVEILHLLVDAGVLEIGADAWQLHEGELGALELPATVQGVVQARLDRLEPELRHLLLHAAVVGRTFWQGALERLRAADPDHPFELATAEILKRLRERQLVRAREAASFAGEHEFVFAEAAVQEVAYHMLGSKLRRSLHLAAADWLEHKTPGNAGAALRALHQDRGGDLARAAAEYRRAAQHASSVGQNAEALRHLERVGRLHDESMTGDEAGEPAGEAHEELRLAPWQDRVHARLELGDVLRRLGRLDDANRAYEEARRQILRVERRRGRALDPGEPGRFDARVDYCLALLHKLRGELDRARVLVERAIARTRDSGELGETPVMYGLLADVYRRQSDQEASYRAGLDGLRACRAARRQATMSSDAIAELLCFLGATLLRVRGRPIAAERTYQQAYRAAGETSLWLAGIALNGVAAARAARGDLAGARDMFTRSLRVKERAGDLHQLAVTYNNLSSVEIDLNDLPAALEHARRSVKLGEQVGAAADLPAFHHNVLEAALAAGLHEEALEAGRKGVAVAAQSGRLYLAGLTVALARVCARISGLDEGAPAETSEPLRARAIEAARELLAGLERYASEPGLENSVEQCRSLLRDLPDARRS